MTPDSKLILARFKSWDEIFPDPAEADRQYSDLLEKLRAGYLGGQTLLRERVEVNPETGLPATIFEKTFGGYCRVERQPDGNVGYEYYYLGETHVEEVIPQAGNKQHDWTLDKIVGLQGQVALAMAESPDPGERLDLDIMLSFIQGKPATIGWEETMLLNEKLPQRVGFRIYPDSNLSAAKEKVKK